MSDGYEWSPSGFDAAQAQVVARSHQIENILDRMHEEVVASLKVWVSDTRERYNQRKAEWDQKAETIPVDVNAAAEALQQIAERLRRGETTSLSIMGG